MKAPPAVHKLRGRPPAGLPLKRPFNVMLDERIAQGLRELGEGNLAAGVALAVEKARKTSAAKRGVLPDVRAALSEGRKPPAKRSGQAGRPVVGLAPRVRTTLQLLPTLVEELRVFGDGVVSQGIERVALLIRAAQL